MELTSEQFRQLTGFELASNGPGTEDRRNGVRVVFGKRAKIRPLFGNAADGGKTALLRDVSVSGIGFLVADAMEVGDEFILRAPVDAGGHLYVHCIVRRCEPGGTGGKQFIAGASYEMVLDPSTLTVEQTADHHERIEDSAAHRAVDDATEADDAGRRGLFSSLRSAIEGRQAAKLRRRLNGGEATDAEGEDGDKSANREYMTPQVFDIPNDAALDRQTPTVSTDPVAAAAPTVVNPNHRSLFAKVEPSAPAPAPAEAKATPAAVANKSLSDSELDAIIASTYGPSAPRPEHKPEAVEQTVAAPPEPEPDSIKQNEPQPVEIKGAENREIEVPAPVVAEVQLPAPPAAVASPEVEAVKVAPTQPKVREKPATPPVKSSPPAAKAKPVAAAPIPLPQPPIQGPAVSAIHKFTALMQPPAATAASQDTEPSTEDSDEPKPTPRTTKKVNGRPRPSGPIQACETVFESHGAYSAQTLEGFAQPAPVDLQSGGEEPAPPKSVYFPPEVDGPHPAPRIASAETLLRAASARSRHSRRRGHKPARR